MKFYIISVLVVLLADACSALYCYQCNSSMGNGCLEEFEFDKQKPVLCEVAEARFCIKTTGVWGAVVGVTRFCSSMDMGTQCQYLPFEDHERVYRACIHTCEGDNCNPAPSLSKSPPLFVLVGVAVVLRILIGKLAAFVI